MLKKDIETGQNYVKGYIHLDANRDASYMRKYYSDDAQWRGLGGKLEINRDILLQDKDYLEIKIIKETKEYYSTSQTTVFNLSEKITYLKRESDDKDMEIQEKDKIIDDKNKIIESLRNQLRLLGITPIYNF